MPVPPMQDGGLGLLDLMDCPTSIDKVHESCYRSYHALRTIERLLEAGATGQVALMFIKEIRGWPQRNTASNEFLAPEK